MRIVSASLFALFSGQILAQSYTSAVIPYVVQATDQQTFLKITGTGPQPGIISINVFDSGGAPVGRTSAPLAKGGGISGTIGDLLGLPQGFNLVGWTQLTSDVPFAASATIINLNDASVAVVPMVQGADTVEYLPQLDLTSGHGDQLIIVNPNFDASSSKSILYDADGALLGTFSLPIPAQGIGSLDISAVFGIAGLAGGHIEVISSLPVIVLERIQNGTQSTFVSGQSLLQGQGPGNWQLVVPLLPSSTNRQQAIILTNPSAAPDPVTVKFYNGDGTPNSVNTLVLDPKAQQVLDVSTALSGGDIGYAVLTAATPPLAIVLGGEGPNQWSLQWVSPVKGDHFLSIAALDGPAATRAAKRSTTPSSAVGTLVDGQPPVTPANLSFILVNLSSASNQFTIETRAVDGTGSGPYSVTVPPGQALTTSLQALFGDASETDSSIRVFSTEESAVFGLYGVLPVAADVPSDAASRLIPALLLQSATISAASGGTVTIDAGSTNALLGSTMLVILPGAIDRDTEVQILYSALSLEQALPGNQLVNYPLRFLPEGLTFSQPAHLFLTLNPPVAEALASDPPLAYQTFNNLTKTWEPFPVSYDAASRTLDVTMPHFSSGVATVAVGLADFTCDVGNDLLGNASDLVGALQDLKTGKLGTSDFAALDAFQTGITLGCSVHKALDQYHSGNTLLAWATIAQDFGQAAGGGACYGLEFSELTTLCQKDVDQIFGFSHELGPQPRREIL